MTGHVRHKQLGGSGLCSSLEWDVTLTSALLLSRSEGLGHRAHAAQPPGDPFDRFQIRLSQSKA